jgi:hypothetical protein
MQSRIRSGITIGIGLVLGLAAAFSCAGAAPRSLCVRDFRSCDVDGAPTCDDAEECVPAEAYDAEALTDCDDGRCVWDCSAGESCPSGWSCKAMEPTLGELIHGGC